MKAKRIWIATHPKNSSIQEIRTSEPNEYGEYLCYDYGQPDPEHVECEYVEYICIPIED